MKPPSFLWVLVTSIHGHYQSRETDEAGGHGRGGVGGCTGKLLSAKLGMGLSLAGLQAHLPHPRAAKQTTTQREAWPSSEATLPSSGQHWKTLHTICEPPPVLGRPGPGAHMHLYSDRFGEESRRLASPLIIGWQVAEEACPIYFLNQNPQWGCILCHVG